MYLRELRIQNLKLMKDLHLRFGIDHSLILCDGEQPPWPAERAFPGSRSSPPPTRRWSSRACAPKRSSCSTSTMADDIVPRPLDVDPRLLTSAELYRYVFGVADPPPRPSGGITAVLTHSSRVPPPVMPNAGRA